MPKLRKMSRMKKQSSAASKGSVGIVEHWGSSQCREIIAGVAMAVYARKIAVNDTHPMPKGDSG